jgi:VCBS repeat-containing protein
MTTRKNRGKLPLTTNQLQNKHLQVMKVFTQIGALIIFALSCATVSHASNIMGAPVAVNDDNYGYEGDIVSGDVSTNDSDPDGDILTYSIVSGPSHGSLILNANGTYTYTPELEYNGFDYVTYQACDPGGLCDEAILELAMLFVNDNPQANNDTFNAFIGSTLNASVSANDIELDDEVNWWTILSPPAGASFFQLNINGTFTYTPEEDFEGQDMFVYQACDPCGACDFAFVYVNVLPPNDPPVTINDAVFIPEDMILNGNVALNDSEPEGEVMTFSIQSMPAHGSLNMNPNGTFTYIPASNFYGVDLFTYQACDIYNQCSSAIVGVEVLFVNDSPIAYNDTLYMNEDTQGAMSAGTNDFEYDIEPLQFIQAYGPDFGSVVWNESNGQFVYTPNENFFGEDVIGYFALDPCGAMDFAEVIVFVASVNDLPVAESDDFEATEDEALEASVAENDFDIDDTDLTFTLNTTPTLGTIEWNEDGTFVFNPNPNQHGLQLLSYTVSDPSGGSDNAMFAIFIEPINDLPVAVADLITGSEDTVISGTVATNDSDPDLTPLTYTFTPGPYNGVFTGNSNGSFTYTPSEDYFGTITIAYQVCDISGACDNSVLTINVLSVNDSPGAGDDSFLVAEETTLNASVADNDSDPESSVLVFSVITGPIFGTINMGINGDFTYTPIDNWNGFEIIIYEVCDPQGACATAELVIEVLFVNDLPQPQSDVFSVNEDGVLTGNVATNDIEPEDEIMYFVILSNPSQGQLVFNGETGAFTFTPNANYSGTVNMSYLACDPCSASALATFTINVLPVNDAPVAVDDTFNVNEDLILNGTVATNDSDIDSSSRTYTLNSNVQNGILNLSANGSFVYTPSSNYNGPDSFTYNVCDGSGACDVGAVAINVTAVNDTPIAEEDSYNLYEDETLTASVATNDFDVDNATLSYSLLSTPLNGVLVFSANGSFSYTPDENYFGNDAFTYMVCDAGGLCSSTVAGIVVLPLNDMPVAIDDLFGTMINTATAGSVATNDYDGDGDALEYTLTSVAQNGQLTFNTDGSFNYLPNAMYEGFEVVTYMVCDIENVCASASLTIQISNNNINPIATDDSFSMNEDEGLVASVGTNDSDDGDVLHFEMIAAPESGFCVMSNDGSFSYTPPANFNGIVHFSYQACDIFGACDFADVSIEVIAVNDAPTALNDFNSTTEDFEDSGWVSFNDEDVDGDVLVYTILSGPLHGTINWFGNGSYTYTPDENYFGEDQLTYQVCDPYGECASATLSLSIIFVNDIPQVEDETFTTEMNNTIEGSVAINDIELDPEELHYNLLTEAENGIFILNEDGTFSYTPNDGFVGTEIIFYEGCDPCGACDQAQLTIEVWEVNTAPFAFDYSIDHCSLNSFTIDLLDISGDSETSDGNLSWSIEEVEAGTLMIEGSILTYTPEFNQSADVTLVYIICDNANTPLCSEASIQLTLSAAYEAEISSAVLTNVTCYGEENGSIDLSVVDEGYTLQYTWSNEELGSQIGDLAAGEYTVVISAEELCTLPHEQTFTIEQPDQLVIDGLIGVDINDLPGGSSDYSVIGGTEPYSYVWTNENDEIVSEEMDLGDLTNSSQAGSYFLTITDANGCSVEQQITITDIVEWNSGVTISLFPNPAADYLVLNALGLPSGSYEYIITDGKGRLVLRAKLAAANGTFNESIDISSLAVGAYNLSLIGKEGNLNRTFVKE